ncbi:ribonuclease T2 family protein [Novosphingobium panipatense]|uniref:ribonuclease T2 family protein n=1 Tax=Novosphingobium panipatense TaxID=428991 RepID=UPI003620565C
MQCNRDNGRFGFILHGLWPEAKRGPSPQWCANRPLPSPQQLREHLCMTPSATLLAREWAKHGSCMVASPQKYFRISAILWRSIRWPDADRLSRKRGSPSRICGMSSWPPIPVGRVEQSASSSPGRVGSARYAFAMARTSGPGPARDVNRVRPMPPR